MIPSSTVFNKKKLSSSAMDSHLEHNIIRKLENLEINKLYCWDFFTINITDNKPMKILMIILHLRK